MNPEHPSTSTDERELLQLIADAEERVARLQEELERRRQWRETSQEREAQHREIDRLATLLEEARVDWRAVGAFVRGAVREQRAGRPWGERADDAADGAPRAPTGKRGRSDGRAGIGHERADLVRGQQQRVREVLRG
ncbi:hypothetical protein [Kocuria marina]|uniref:hypothetical protein n=1 Tax=Kocuria marina TaxID=223184 RepID=UPI0022E1A41F|nr:hypothetical protein [Kocuria marina]